MSLPAVERNRRARPYVLEESHFVPQRRLLTVAHSYVVGLNRRLAHELMRAGQGRWEVTCIAPRRYRGDLGSITLEPLPDEPCRPLPVGAYLTRQAHLFFYGAGLRDVLARDWDLVHAWEEPYVLAGFQLAEWARPRSRYVFWTAQNIAKRYPPPFSWFEQRVLKRADAWLYCGQTVAGTLGQRSDYARLPSAAAPLGVDQSVFAPDLAARRAVRERLGWTLDGPPVVGFSGRFVAEKGVELLLQALSASKVPFRALLLGAGPLQGQIERWASRYGDRVRMLSVAHADVPAYLNAMDLLCAPSATTPRWREQFGRMLVEAMACGVPVLGSDSGEIPFVVAGAGRILPEADAAAWTGAIESLLDDAARRRELAQAGLERVSREFAWPVIAERQLAFFERVVEGRT